MQIGGKEEEEAVRAGLACLEAWGESTYWRKSSSHAVLGCYHRHPILPFFQNLFSSFQVFQKTLASLGIRSGCVTCTSQFCHRLEAVFLSIADWRRCQQKPSPAGKAVLTPVGCPPTASFSWVVTEPLLTGGVTFSDCCSSSYR